MGMFGSFFGLNRYYIPYGMTPNERAQELLDEAKYHANEINKSETVFDFSYSYEKLSEITDELIWLNEKKKVSMYPAPRTEWDKIQKNMGATINGFIDRAISTVDDSDQLRSEKIRFIFDEMENDGIFSTLIRAENKKRMSDILSSEGKKHRETIENNLLTSVGIKPDLDLSELNPMKVIEALEKNIETIYRIFYTKSFSSDIGKELFSNFKSACESSNLPLMAEIRLESLFESYAPKFESPNPMSLVDCMEGHDFEQWCASLLVKNGFINVEVTPSSGDQGVDVLAEKDGIRYAIQCKCYSSDLGNTPVQEVHTGKELYRCQIGVVMTNRYFTNGAKQAAAATGTLLWDRDRIQKMIEAAK